MSEILPNVHRVESIFGGRWLASYLFLGERTLIIDSGFAPTAKNVIIPYLRRCGLESGDLHWLVVTHASGDHFGGNGALKNYAPRLTIIAHEQDAGSIASHATFMAEHVEPFQPQGAPAVQPNDPEFLALHGPEVPIDWVVQGGERLRLSAGWTVELLHLPGHTPGHLAVYDPLNRALFAGDALMGAGIPDTQGRLVMPPHYFDVDWYLASIERARLLGAQHLLATHYLPLSGAAAPAFLDASQAFVTRLEAVLLDVLQSADKPLDLPALIVAVRDQIGIPESDYQYRLVLQAHLMQLARRGRVGAVDQTGSMRWTVAA